MPQEPEQTHTFRDCDIMIIIRYFWVFVKEKPGVERAFSRHFAGTPAGLFVYFAQKQVTFSGGHWQYKVLQNL